MCVDDGSQIHLPSCSLISQDGTDPAQVHLSARHCLLSLDANIVLRRICGIDDDSVVGRFVRNKIGIIVGAANPYHQFSRSRASRRQIAYTLGSIGYASCRTAAGGEAEMRAEGV